MGISGSPILVDWSSGTISGGAVKQSAKTVGQLPGLFRDEAARRRLDPDTLVYRVQFWQPVPSGTEGGLFWGTTILEPGKGCGFRCLISNRIQMGLRQRR